jgi:protein-L-isoaspartate(D-aspartate) O-methyltransferase
LSYNTYILIDTYRHKGLREKLVNELIRKGISDQNVLLAIGKIPRHFMLDRAFDTWAYKDQAFPIDANQTISQPYTVALQSQLLEIKKLDKVLEVGTGSGYQAAVLSELGAKVYTIERQAKLFDKTAALLLKMGYGAIRTLKGDGYEGADRFAPFDKIIVTAGAAQFPHKLLDQLKIGGIMVIPSGYEGEQQMMRYIKTAEKDFRKENHGPCSFVPMLKGIQN